MAKGSEARKAPKVGTPAKAMKSMKNMPMKKHVIKVAVPAKAMKTMKHATIKRSAIKTKLPAKATKTMGKKAEADARTVKLTIATMGGKTILDKVELERTEKVSILIDKVQKALGHAQGVYLICANGEKLLSDLSIEESGLEDGSTITAVRKEPQPWKNVTSALRKLLEGVWFDGSAGDVSKEMCFAEGKLGPQAASADDTLAPVNQFTCASREFPSGRTRDALDPHRAELERLARAQIRVQGERRRFLVGPFRDILSYRAGNTAPYWCGKDDAEIVAIQAQLAELAETQQGLELMWASGDNDTCQYDHGFCLINHDGRWIKFYNTDLIWA